jgi:hypothetical protein
MGFMQILRIMIFIVIISIVILVGQIVTFNHIEVFLKGLPPTQVTHAVMRIVFSILKSLFHYILIFLIIMYIIYLIVKKFVPNFPLPFKTIILSITPLYELRKAGVFGLFDAIIGIFTSKAPFLTKMVALVRAFGRFLAAPYYLLQGSATGYVLDLGGGPSQKKQKPKPAQEGEFNTEDDTEGEPTYDESLSPNENKFIQKEYQQCLSENYLAETDNMSTLEKASVGTKNATTKIICDVKKLQSYSTLVTSKF